MMIKLEFLSRWIIFFFSFSRDLCHPRFSQIRVSGWGWPVSTMRIGCLSVYLGLRQGVSYIFPGGGFEITIREIPTVSLGDTEMKMAQQFPASGHKPSARRKTKKTAHHSPVAGGFGKSFGCAILNLGSAPSTWKAPQIVKVVWYHNPQEDCVNAHKYPFLKDCLDGSSPCLIVIGPTFPLGFQNENWVNVILEGG